MTSSLPRFNSLAVSPDDLTAWRRDLHQHPELGYEEHRTSRLIADKLREFGVDAIEEGLGGTGVVATIHGKGGAAKDASQAILLRADIDALPIQEIGDAPYKSAHDGKMHACGHDGHTAMLLGAAKHLAATRAFKGSVYLCFQPAEEGGAGAKAMIDGGLFEKFPCRQVFGMHNWPGVAPGTFAVRPGPIMAMAGTFEIALTGLGGHAAMPDLCRDPVLAGAAIVQALQQIVSRRASPMESVVLSMTAFQAGDAFNIIPETAVLRGTLRAFDEQIYAAAKTSLESIAHSVGAAYQTRVEIDHKRDPYPPTVNDADATAFAASIAQELVGVDAVETNTKPSMGGEDFAYMTQVKPGCYIHIGNGDSAGLHHPAYDFNDAIAPLGVAYWARLTERALPL